MSDGLRSFEILIREKPGQTLPTLLRLNKVFGCAKANGFQLLDASEVGEVPPGCRPLRMVPDDGEKPPAPPPAPAGPYPEVEWAAFMATWWQVHGGTPATARALLDLALAEGLLGGTLGGGSEDSRHALLHRALKALAGCDTGFRVEAGRERNGGRARLYWLRKLGDQTNLKE